MIVDIQKRALHRTRIIEGQIRGLEKMIEQEEYCLDIITQSLAIQRSLKRLNKLVLENHLKIHFSEKIKSDKEKEQQEAVEELLNLYELSNVRS